VNSKLITVLVNRSAKKTGTIYKIFSLIFGAIIFLVVFPAIFLQIGKLIENYIVLYWNSWHEIILTIISIPLRLSILLWTTITQWVIGKGTPAPNAPTQKLIIVGPYKYCRNPIQLGAIIYYVGVGTYFVSLTTGIICGGLGLIIGSIYHKLVEEKELELHLVINTWNIKSVHRFFYLKYKLLLIKDR